MNVTEERRVIASNPQRVVVKYAGGEEERHFDNDVIEVVIADVEENDA